MSAEKGSIPLILIPVFLAVITISGLLFLNSKNFIHQVPEAIILEENENNGENCYSQNYFKYLSEREFVKDATLTYISDPGLNVNRGIGSIGWRRAGDEPNINFPGQTFLAYNNSPQSFQTVNYLYKQKLEPLIFTKGFIKDALNVEYKPSGDNGFMTYGESEKYGYRKGDLILVVSIGETSPSEGNMTTSFGMGCSKIDKVYDNAYSELALSWSGRKVLNEAAGDKGLKNVSLSIWEIHQNVIKTNIGRSDWFSGNSAWFGKNEKGEWHVFYTGQQDPDCEELEKYKVEPGVACYRSEKESLTR